MNPVEEVAVSLEQLAIRGYQGPKNILERTFLDHSMNEKPRCSRVRAVGFMLTIEERDAKIVVLPVDNVPELKINISEFVVCELLEQYKRPIVFGKELFMVQSQNEIYLSCGNAFEMCFWLLQNLIKVFPVEIYAYKVDFNKLCPGNLNNLLTFPSFRSCKELVMIGDTIDADLTNRILDVVNPEILGMENQVQPDFPFEKAFRLSTVIFHQAQNVKIEWLLGDFESEKIILKNTSFDCRDVNQFLTHLVNHGFRNLEYFSIGIKQGLRFEKQLLFKGIATARLPYERNTYLLSSEVFDGTPYQFKMAKLHFEPTTNTLTFSKFTTTHYTTVKKIMILLRQKEDIKAQLVNNNRVLKNLERQNGKLDIPGCANDTDPWQAYHVVQNERRMLKEQLAELSLEIEQKPVYLCADGFYEFLYRG